MAEDINVVGTYYADSGYNYPYYFDAVIDEAVNTYGLDEEDLLNRGYKIYTGLDQDYQNQMDNAYANAYLPAAEDGTLAAECLCGYGTGNRGCARGRRSDEI
jgi:penicillin-binding protein 2A